MTFYVYGLAEEDGPVRYVGKSSNPHARLSSHRSSAASNAVRMWIESLTGRVSLRILDEAADAGSVAILEREWIEKLSPGLLNVSSQIDTRPSAPRVVRFSGIGERCVQRRKALGIKQREVCRLANCDEGRLSRLERGHRPHITAESAVLLARALECSVEWLVTGEERDVARAAE